MSDARAGEVWVDVHTLTRLQTPIRKTGRSAQGVRLIKTDEGDKVTSASLVEAAAEEEEE